MLFFWGCGLSNSCVFCSYKEALEKIKFEDVHVDDFFVSMDKITEVRNEQIVQRLPLTFGCL